MTTVKFSATQFAATSSFDENMSIATKLVEKSCEEGANVVLLQELFAGYYWCKDQDPKYYEWAESFDTSKILQHFSALAKKLNVVLPISYFEKSENTFFNSLAMIDANGDILDNYRKSHIPDGPGYQEKYYFTPGDTGFKVWQTTYGKLGAAICWDQWFPEAARIMALKGAEVLMYPTAIGSEPQDPTWDSRRHWQRVMQGHSAANVIPVIASNRVGREVGETCEITFYGSSFITNQFGEKVQEAEKSGQSIISHSFDLNEIRKMRESWGLFRDRRPELYQKITQF